MRLVIPLPPPPKETRCHRQIVAVSRLDKILLDMRSKLALSVLLAVSIQLPLRLQN
jgi:hypothetical protein